MVVVRGSGEGTMESCCVTDNEISVWEVLEVDGGDVCRTM